jgi:acyl carrier protein
MNSSRNIGAEVVAFVARIANVADVSEASSLSDLHIQSLALVRMLLHLEIELGVELGLAELDASRLRSVADLVRLVELSAAR